MKSLLLCCVRTSELELFIQKKTDRPLWAIGAGKEDVTENIEFTGFSNSLARTTSARYEHDSLERTEEDGETRIRVSSKFVGILQGISKEQEFIFSSTSVST